MSVVRIPAADAAERFDVPVTAGLAAARRVHEQIVEAGDDMTIDAATAGVISNDEMWAKLETHLNQDNLNAIADDDAQFPGLPYRAIAMINLHAALTEDAHPEPDAMIIARPGLGSLPPQALLVLFNQVDRDARDTRDPELQALGGPRMQVFPVRPELGWEHITVHDESGVPLLSVFQQKGNRYGVGRPDLTLRERWQAGRLFKPVEPISVRSRQNRPSLAAANLGRQVLTMLWNNALVPFFWN